MAALMEDNRLFRIKADARDVREKFIWTRPYSKLFTSHHL